ncbi:hypothetical protein FF1_040756 [Malus domestica]
MSARQLAATLWEINDMPSQRVKQCRRTKAACRSIPTIIEIYNLDDVVTPFHLLTVITSKIRKNANVTNPKVIDMLLFKAMEELNNVTEHAKQRCHIIGQYVVGQQGLMQNSGKKGGPSSIETQQNENDSVGHMRVSPRQLPKTSSRRPDRH